MGALSTPVIMPVSGAVTGVILVSSNTFTSNTGTTAYTIGDLIGNSLTNTAIVSLQFSVATANGGTGSIRRARVKTTDTGANGGVVRVHLFKLDPAAAGSVVNGDNGVFLVKESSWIGALDVTMSQHFADFEKGNGTPNTGSELNFATANTGTIIYSLLEARSAITPVGGKPWTIDLEVFPN